MFMRNEKVGMTLGPLDVAVQGDHATVRCTVALTGGAAACCRTPARIRRSNPAGAWKTMSGG